MTITPGTRLGPYEVVAPIGAGGMGEVFKGRDTRLDRSVAIKLLPAEFAANSQLKHRFEREAKSISQLNHPHICTLYDVGQQDGIDYLVMELVEGEPLDQRVARGPLPLDQVIRCGIEIANALEKAHKAGIVHRDLKPGNVMLTKSGAKLLDFGLAKSGGSIGGQSKVTAEDATIAAVAGRPLTEEGTIIGTFQYMAPEQIEGREADARTDIFALGAVLYELVTGRRAFEAKSKASLIASILAAEPRPIAELQPMAPATFDRIVRKCLAKDPDERWQSAHDVATALGWLRETPDAAPPRGQAKREWIAWGAVALLAIAAVGAGTIAWRKSVALRNTPIVRTAILPPDKMEFGFSGGGAPPAISPDGTKIVYGANEPGKTGTLWLRPLDSFVAQQLAGTESAMYPFWSPDGHTVAFFAENSLKKMDIAGGSPVTLCPVVDGRGGTWSPDGSTIVFAGRFTPLFRVSASGGTAVEITKLNKVMVVGTHRWPEFLPDSQHVLFLASPSGSDDPSDTIMVASLDGKVQKALISAANEPHYLNGYIIFARDHQLTAQPFDEKKLAMTGEAFPLKEPQVESVRLFSRAVITVSRNGTLVYQRGASDHLTQLTWFDRSGKIVGNVGEPGPYNALALGPDEKQVLASYNSPHSNVSLFDLSRGVKSRVTFGGALDIEPVWSPDGRKFVYTSLAAGKARIVLRDLTTGSEKELMTQAFGAPWVTDWSADGDRILIVISGRASRLDIWWLSLSEGKAHVYLGTPFVESAARFSPDGKWVAYHSSEGGGNDVYVAPFPPTGAKWQVSGGGGVVPRWRADGKELFYLVPSSPGKMMAVPISLEATPRIGQAVKLFEFRVGEPSSGIYDVTRDGQRFLANARLGGDPIPPPLSVVQHFDCELRGLMEKKD